MSGVKIYFVLYIVLLCEIFIVILDRDDTLNKWQVQHEKLERIPMEGMGCDFKLEIPNNNLEVTVFSTTTGGQSEKSDIIKTAIIGKAFVKDDDSIDFKIYWEREPNFSTSRLKVDTIKPAIQTEKIGAYIFSINYNYNGWTGGQDREHFDSCKVRVECRFLRKITPEIQSEIEGGNNICETLSYNKEYVRLKSSEIIKIYFNKSYIDVKCPPQVFGN